MENKMDDKFMENLKSMSQGILEEQQLRPETAYRSLIPTARVPSAFGLGRPPTGGAGLRSDSLSEEVTTLASYRPESAAFTFTGTRPMTGRMMADSDRGSVRGIAQPSARPVVRQGLTSSRPRTSFRKFDDSEAYIPDLDEVREDDLTMTVASAPSYELQRIASLTELDAELSQTKALSVVDGVNLRKLCKFIVPEKELVEHDEPWTWDRLYTEIISSPDLNHLVRFQKENESDFDSLNVK
ncbi:intraflagellar transport protein 43 homolog [Folsomia candida]|uniref:intraflagellar transport protein 43 homolog n=1 Tax=Folsomia candida TaxID=158441 RepID=UPI000B8F4659|nr:intraflagellar transport protein 43 homolog [Folsomia candida]XP_021946749.1 intraflagellar transport protein 43 homolog [Folsomia candida]XP_035703839.1 intraflagellar transport protein 43 homolog [Folsomia candida]